MNNLDALVKVAASRPFPSASFTSQLESERGFHLTSTSHIDILQTSDTCTLHALFLFPSDLFVDRYELEQRRQDGVLGKKFQVWGETDLELPVQAVDRRGSALLIGLHANQSILDVPFHLRYLEPATSDGSILEGFSGSYRILESPWPFVFQACPNDEGISYLGFVSTGQLLTLQND